MTNFSKIKILSTYEETTTKNGKNLTILECRQCMYTGDELDGSCVYLTIQTEKIKGLEALLFNRPINVTLSGFFILNIQL